VSILYHVKDPYRVFTLLGPGRLFESNGIVPKAEPILKQTLGELTPRSSTTPRSARRRPSSHDSSS